MSNDVSDRSLPLYAAFIDGKMAESAKGAFDLVTPQDVKTIGRIAESGEAVVDRAVQAAAAAFAANRKQPTH